MGPKEILVMTFLLSNIVNCNVISEPTGYSRLDWEAQLLYKAAETNILMKQYMEQLQTALQTMAAKTEEITQLKKVLEETNADFRAETMDKLKAMEQTVQGIMGEARTPIVSFNARSAVDRSPDEDQIMVYKTVLQNIGDAYDSVTGIFTTPLAGTFMFNVNVCTLGNKWSQLQLVVDSRDNLILAFGHYSSVSHDSSSGSVTHYLTKGQRVWVQSEHNSGSSNTLYETGDYCWNQFSGTLLNH